MVSFIDRIVEVPHEIYLSLKKAMDSMQKGTLDLLSEGSRTLYDLSTCVDGLERVTKSGIAVARYIQFIPAINGVFAEFIKTSEGLKDIFYATALINSLNDFVDVNTKTGKMRFSFPVLPDKKTEAGYTIDKEGYKRNDDGWRTGRVDTVKVLYLVANFCETTKFIQRCNLYAFPLCAQLGAQVGSWKVFNTSTTINQIPVVNSLCFRPKDFFIFVASMVETYKCIQKGDLSWPNVLKCTGSVGKILLISLGGHYGNRHWFVLIDVITQNASLIAFIIKRRSDRMPKTTIPAA